MISTRDIDDIIGAEAVDQDNDRIGKVGQIYLDSESDEPVWVTVKSGLFGSSETLVPLSGANWDNSALHLAFQKDRVKDAPRVEPDAELSPEEQDRLYEYYGLGSGAAGAGGIDAQGGYSDASADLTDGLGRSTIDDDAAIGAAGAGYTSEDTTPQNDSAVTRDADLEDGTATRDAGVGQAGLQRDADDTTTRDSGFGDAGVQRDAGAGYTAAASVDDSTRGAGYDTSGPNTDEAMTRSEERLNVGVQQVETGRARLRKYVVTEQQTVTVPVTHEEVRIEREPITDANRGQALGGADLSEEEHEVVLTEERPVVQKETVPVERVRLATEQVTENREVTEDVRHEEIETDGGTDRVGDARLDTDADGRTERPGL